MQNPAPTFADPSLAVARRNLRVLFSAFEAATGWPTTFVARITAGEPKFQSIFEQRDFTHSTYDRVAGRMSALWPEGAEWPEGIPRQAPAEIPPDILERIAARADPKNAREPRVRLPGGADWPTDIPKPTTPTARAAGGNHGKTPQA